MMNKSNSMIIPSDVRAMVMEAHSFKNLNADDQAAVKVAMFGIDDPGCTIDHWNFWEQEVKAGIEEARATARQRFVAGTWCWATHLTQQLWDDRYARTT